MNPPVIDTTIFATPNTPDLGCFVERRHGFQFDGPWALWAEFAPWNNQEGILPHQAYFRVTCGRAAFFQRVKVWMRPQLDSQIFNGIAPDHVLGGGPRRSGAPTPAPATATTSTTTAPSAPRRGTTPAATRTSTT